MLLLPNLSLLSIDAPGDEKRKNDDDDDKQLAKRSRQRQQQPIPLREYDFFALLSSETLKNGGWFEMTVTSNAWPGKETTFTFLKSRYEHVMQMSVLSVLPTPCVRVELNLNSKTVDIVTLFYTKDHERDKILSTCDVKPNMISEQENAKGLGAFVLSSIQAISACLDFKNTIQDNAEFRSGTFQGRLNLKLSMLRGFGFYEARGFIPEWVFDAADFTARNEDDTLDHKVFRDAIQIAAKILFDWTTMFSTTPIIDLAFKLENFPSIFNATIGDRGDLFLKSMRSKFHQTRLKLHASAMLPKVEVLINYIKQRVNQVDANTLVSNLTIRQIYSSYSSSSSSSSFSPLSSEAFDSIINRLDNFVLENWSTVHGYSIFRDYLASSALKPVDGQQGDETDRFLISFSQDGPELVSAYRHEFKIQKMQEIEQEDQR